MHVAFFGLGLVGGSVARALRADSRPWTIAAWAPRGVGPRAALAAGVIDAAPSTAAGALAGADLVVLAAPPTACLELIDELVGPLRSALAPGATVTDVASTKARIVARADAVGLAFVGGHPMAGRETAGFGASAADLFQGRPWVVVPGRLARDADVARVEALARACGAVPVRMEGGAHDEAVAAVSHLPLVLSAALVEAVVGGPGDGDEGWPAAAALAAGGWDSATRLARGDPVMGAGIAATNPGPLAARLRVLRARLDEWLALLESGDGSPDEDALRARLVAARERLLAPPRPPAPARPASASSPRPAPSDTD